MHQVTAVEPKWLSEVAPTFFRVADHNRISKRKAGEKIEPLFDRYATDKDSWVSSFLSVYRTIAHHPSVSAKSNRRQETRKSSERAACPAEAVPRSWNPTVEDRYMYLNCIHLHRSRHRLQLHLGFCREIGMTLRVQPGSLIELVVDPLGHFRLRLHYTV